MGQATPMKAPTVPCTNTRVQEEATSCPEKQRVGLRLNAHYVFFNSDKHLIHLQLQKSQPAQSLCRQEHSVALSPSPPSFPPQSYPSSQGGSGLTSCLTTHVSHTHLKLSAAARHSPVDIHLTMLMQLPTFLGPPRHPNPR